LREKNPKVLFLPRVPRQRNDPVELPSGPN
jgi:hypothetical protein